MILQFIGFFVVLGAGGFIVWYTIQEMQFQSSLSSDCRELDTLVEIALIIIGCCLGYGLMYYAVTHAPFTINFNLKV